MALLSVISYYIPFASSRVSNIFNFPFALTCPFPLALKDFAFSLGFLTGLHSQGFLLKWYCFSLESSFFTIGDLPSFNL